MGEVKDDCVAVGERSTCDAVVVVGGVSEQLYGVAERLGEEGRERS